MVTEDARDHVDATPSGLGDFASAFGGSFGMILVSEIGDETFIIAALMAMRHPRAIVFAGALGALIVMTVLSTALGFIVPNLLSRQVTNKAATVLYTFFGLRLLYIAYRAEDEDPNKELDEVRQLWEQTYPFHCAIIFCRLHTCNMLCIPCPQFAAWYCCRWKQL